MQQSQTLVFSSKNQRVDYNMLFKSEQRATTSDWDIDVFCCGPTTTTVVPLKFHDMDEDVAIASFYPNPTRTLKSSAPNSSIVIIGVFC